MTKTMIALAAALTLAAPGLARADGTTAAGTLKADGPYQRFSFDAAGSVTFRVGLERGQGYALEVGADEDPGLTFTVRAADGSVVAKAVEEAAEEATQGFSFRAAYTGTYFVDVATDRPVVGVVAVGRDCLATWQTDCKLPVGATLAGRSYNYETDVDWYRAYLKAGVGYLLSADRANGLAVGQGGRAFATTRGTSLAFTAPRSGIYYLEADAAGPEVRYRISLQRTGR